MTARQNDPETVREEGVNVLLEQSLRGHGLKARAERRSRRGAPDVLVELRSGDLVVLECKWESSVGLLETQLDERLKSFPEALGMVGVLYPDGLRYEDDMHAGLEAATDLRWWLHGSRGALIPDRHIRKGSAADLADQLRNLPLELECVDRVAAAAGAVGYAFGTVGEATQQTRPAIPAHRGHHRPQRPREGPRRRPAQRLSGALQRPRLPDRHNLR